MFNSIISISIPRPECDWKWWFCIWWTFPLDLSTEPVHNLGWKSTRYDAHRTIVYTFFSSKIGICMIVKDLKYVSSLFYYLKHLRFFKSKNIWNNEKFEKLKIQIYSLMDKISSWDACASKMPNLHSNTCDQSFVLTVGQSEIVVL